VTQSDQPGLRLRLAHEARRIAIQHGYLDALEATTLRTLEHGDPTEMRQALHGFHGSLDAHFTLEEQVHFPALHGLRPDFGPELDELINEHASFRDELRRIETSLHGSAWGAAEVLAAFRDVAAGLGRHEEREERLLSRAGQPG
jgi:iron-sulfur cluster repair protein YtfE (RIC family)